MDKIETREVYCIVKRVTGGYEKEWNKNPINGVTLRHSAALSYSGKQAHICEYYLDKEKAEFDCNRINLANPVGWYGVCKVLKVDSFDRPIVDLLNVEVFTINDDGKRISENHQRRSQEAVYGKRKQTA